jgi:hypothetical protein
MKRLATFLAAAAVLAAGPTAAQDMGGYAGMFSAVADGMGQGVGQSISGAHSVFVYAQGRAAIRGVAPATAASAKPETYQVQVAFTGPTAVEAAGKRDALLARLAAVAQRFNAGIRTSDVAIVLGDPCAGRAGRRMIPACFQVMAVAVAPAPAADAPSPSQKKPDLAPQFSATADVTFSIADLTQAPAFLDALHAAGVDAIGNMDETGMAPNLFMRPNAFAAAAAVDEKTWDDATRDAVRAARRQAGILAEADGRSVGEARQILFLARTVDGGQATVTVAVRFDLAGSKH